MAWSRTIAVAVIGLAAARSAEAQCPDGTPPPCAAARRAVSSLVPARGGLRISARAGAVPTARVVVRAAIDVPAGSDERSAFEQLAVQLLAPAGLRSDTADITLLTTR